VANEETSLPKQNNTPGFAKSALKQIGGATFSALFPNLNALISKNLDTLDTEEQGEEREEYNIERTFTGSVERVASLIENSNSLLELAHSNIVKQNEILNHIISEYDSGSASSNAGLIDALRRVKQSKAKATEEEEARRKAEEGKRVAEEEARRNAQKTAEQETPEENLKKPVEKNPNKPSKKIDLKEERVISPEDLLDKNGNELKGSARDARIEKLEREGKINLFDKNGNELKGSARDARLEKIARSRAETTPAPEPAPVETPAPSTKVEAPRPVEAPPESFWQRTTRTLGNVAESAKSGISSVASEGAEIGRKSLKIAGKAVGAVDSALAGAVETVAGKVLMPALIAKTIYDGFVEIMELDSNDPNYKVNVTKVIAHLVDQFGLAWVGGVIGTYIGAMAGSVVPGFGNLVGAAVGLIGGFAGGYVASEFLGKSVDDLVDSIIDQIAAKTSTTAVGKDKDVPELLFTPEGIPITLPKAVNEIVNKNEGDSKVEALNLDAKKIVIDSSDGSSDSFFSRLGKSLVSGAEAVGSGLSSAASAVGTAVSSAASAVGDFIGFTASSGVQAILDTIKGRESGGNYKIHAKGSSASGAYQFIDSTWQSLTKKFGVGTEYKSAADAPPGIQDQIAGNFISDILKANNNDVSKVPLVWYTGNAQGKISEAALAANRGLTPQQYQAHWMQDYAKRSGQQLAQASTADQAATTAPKNIAANVPVPVQQGSGTTPSSAQATNTTDISIKQRLGQALAA